MCKHKIDRLLRSSWPVGGIPEGEVCTDLGQEPRSTGAGWKTGQEITAPPWLWPQTIKAVGPFVDLSLALCHDLEVTSPRPSKIVEWLWGCFWRKAPLFLFVVKAFETCL